METNMSNVQEVTDAILDAHRNKESTIPKMVSSQYFKALPIYDQKEVLKNLTSRGLTPNGSLGSTSTHLQTGLGMGASMIGAPALAMMATNAISEGRKSIGVKAMKQMALSKLPMLAGATGIAGLVGAGFSLYNAHRSRDEEADMISALNSKDSNKNIDKYLITGKFQRTPQSNDLRDKALKLGEPFKNVVVDQALNTNNLIQDAFYDSREKVKEYTARSQDKSRSRAARQADLDLANEHYRNQEDYNTELNKRGL